MGRQAVAADARRASTRLFSRTILRLSVVFSARTTPETLQRDIRLELDTYSARCISRHSCRAGICRTNGRPARRQPESPRGDRIGPAAVPAPTVPQTKSPYAGKTVLALDMQGIGLPPETLKTLTEQLASALVGIKEMTISTNVELATLLGHAEEQERLGCTADRECLAKLARLAKSDFLLLSTAGKVGNNFVLTLRGIEDRRRRTELQAHERSDYVVCGL